MIVAPVIARRIVAGIRGRILRSPCIVMQANVVNTAIFAAPAKKCK